SLKIVMENPNHLNEPNEAIPEVNPVVPEPNQVVDIHDPNEMVDIPDDIDLVDYDGEDLEEDPEEDHEEEPEEDVDIELEDDAELIFLYEVEGDKTQRTRRGLFEVGESSSTRDSSNVDGLAPWALRRDLKASRAQARVMETKLVWARMERETAERRLHESRVWNKMFYLDMVRIGAVPKPPSDDEDTKRPRKKSKNSTSDGTEGPSEPRGPPIELDHAAKSNVRGAYARMANMNRGAGGDEAGGAGADGARAGGAGAGGVGAGAAGVGGAGPAAPKITRCTYVTFM
ncbi:hypothetical protein Tco_1267130, partial [Tanacetum coccineum]